MENGMQMTLEGCMPETFQKQIAGASDSHVRTSPLQENSLDFKGTVQVCFSELCTLFLFAVVSVAFCPGTLSVPG